MADEITRRTFIKSAAMAGAIAGPLGALAADEQTKKVVLAAVGCAHSHMPGYLGLLKASPDVKVKYVWDHDKARAQKWAQEMECKVATDLQDIWADAEVAGVVIGSETNRYRELVPAAAKAKKHIFVEKPLGISADESAAMADAIEKAGVLFTIGYFQRTLPYHLFIKEQIAKGTLGKITRVYAATCHNGAQDGTLDGEYRWMTDPKIAGTGAFGNLGTHSLDLLMWMLGDVDSVTADIKPVTGHFGECDETGEALIRFKNGTTGTIVGSWVEVATPVTLMVSGTQGEALVRDDHLYFICPKVEGADGRKLWTKLPPNHSQPVLMFVEAIAGQSDLPLVKPREAAARVRVMEAMYRASREKRWITVS